MKELRNEVIEFIEKHKGELVLDGFSVVKLEGFSEDEDDYYYCVINDEGERYQLSCLIGLILLKDKIEEIDYQKLEEIF